MPRAARKDHIGHGGCCRAVQHVDLAAALIALLGRAAKLRAKVGRRLATDRDRGRHPRAEELYQGYKIEPSALTIRAMPERLDRVTVATGRHPRCDERRYRRIERWT